jgi:hypothetical protein
MLPNQGGALSWVQHQVCGTGSIKPFMIGRTGSTATRTRVQSPRRSSTASFRLLSKQPKAAVLTNHNVESLLPWSEEIAQSCRIPVQTCAVAASVRSFSCEDLLTLTDIIFSLYSRNQYPRIQRNDSYVQ